MKKLTRSSTIKSDGNKDSLFASVLLMLILGLSCFQPKPVQAQVPPPPLPLRCLHSFSQLERAGRGLVKASDGNFYGLSGAFWDRYPQPFIFRITPKGTFTVIHTIDSSEGTSSSDIYLGLDNCLYYVTHIGSIDVYDINKVSSSGAYTLVYSFFPPADMRGGNLITTSFDGVLYGIAPLAGYVPPSGPGQLDRYLHTNGVLYSMSVDGVASTLYAWPEGGSFLGSVKYVKYLCKASNGNFYLFNDNYIYSLTPAGTLTVMKSIATAYQGTAFGATSNISQGPDGSIYGIDGSEGGRKLYKLTLGGSFSIIHSFDGLLLGTANYDTPSSWPYGGQIHEGAGPAGAILAADGNLYGGNAAGSFWGNAGTLFRITPDGTDTDVYDFVNNYSAAPFGADGQVVYDQLVQGNDGNLYGNSQGGGKYGVGTVFELILHPPRYEITDLGTLGGTSSRAFGLNTQGQVVGCLVTSGGATHAFLWNPIQPNSTSGQMQDLGVLAGGVESVAASINDNGQVVGTSYDINQNPQAFLWDSGTFSPLGTLGGSFSYGEAINYQAEAAGSAETISQTSHSVITDTTNWTKVDLGAIMGGAYNINNSSRAYSISNNFDVVGEADTPGGDTHAFSDEYDTSDNGNYFRDLGTLPGGTYSSAYCVNDRGQIVGESDTSSGDIHACEWSNGIRSDLGALPTSSFTDSSAFAISGIGEVVGTSYTDAGYHAVLWYSNTIFDLNARVSNGSGWVLEAAMGANAQGQIVGYGTINSQEHAFLLTPLQ